MGAKLIKVFTSVAVGVALLFTSNFTSPGPFQTSLMFVGRSGADPRLEQLKSDSLGYAFALLTNIRLC